jgi:hypothetical protein
MRVLRTVLWVILMSAIANGAQNAAGPKEWTPWMPVEGNWVQFAVVTNFDSDAPAEELAKKDLKSLKVYCLIGGKLLGDLPIELQGVKTFRILYTEYGEFRTWEDFRESSMDVSYTSKGQYIREVSIKRNASKFDVAEASKPITEIERTTTVPTILSNLGVGPLKGKLSGHRYRVGAEWRRKGKTVEIKIKDYRPTVPAGTKPTP